MRRFGIRLLWSALCLISMLAAACAASAKEITRSNLTVTYAEADADIAERSLQIAEEAVAEFATHLPLGEEQVHITIAPTMEEFHRLAPNFQHLHVSGVADSDEGRIILKSPRLRNIEDDYVGTIRHELVHILLYRNARSLPRWINEGTAMLLANEYRWSSTLTVGKMFLSNRIIPYSRLDFAFMAPYSNQQFGDAYAQSLSMTRYLMNRIGEEKFFAVLRGTREMSFPDALREFGGLSPTQFWNLYERSLWRVAVISTLTSGSFFGPAAFILLIAVWRKRISNRKILRRWEAEEKATEGVELFNWDEHVEDEEAWKGEDDDDGEGWKR